MARRERRRASEARNGKYGLSEDWHGGGAVLRLDLSAGIASVTIDNPPVNAWGEAELDDLARFIDAIRGS